MKFGHLAVAAPPNPGSNSCVHCPPVGVFDPFLLNVGSAILGCRRTHNHNIYFKMSLISLQKYKYKYKETETHHQDQYGPSVWLWLRHIKLDPVINGCDIIQTGTGILLLLVIAVGSC